MTDTIQLQWHTVCGSVEIEELERTKQIKKWQPRIARHGLFLTMKYPDTRFYKGAWGAELLHFVYYTNTTHSPTPLPQYQSRVGRVYCSLERSIEITNWFRTMMFAS
jgi:hypothetical protein